MGPPINIASPLNYDNPCAKISGGANGLNAFLVSRINQKNPELRKHTQPLASHFGKVNNAASTHAPYIYYTGLEGGCLKSGDPDVNPAGGQWLNNCNESVNKGNNYSLDALFHSPPGSDIHFNDEQKAILQSLNEVIPGFNQLHIDNKQFCNYDNDWHYVANQYDPKAISVLGDKLSDGGYNPTHCSGGQNDILCNYFKCPGGSIGGAAKCGARDNPLYVMKDTQQYKQTLDGQYLDGIGPDNIDKIIKNKKWDDKYDVGHCVSPDDTNCKPSDIKQWVSEGESGQGGKPCKIYNLLGGCMEDSFEMNPSENVSYANTPVLTTGGTCYYAGVGGYFNGPTPASTLYNKKDQYHDRYVKNLDYASTSNKWNYTGGSAYGMLDWDPGDDSNQVTRALDSVFPPSSPGTNKSFDLSQFKAKCDSNPADQVTALQAQFTSGTALSTSNAQTLACPVACPFDKLSNKCMPRAVCKTGDLTPDQKVLKLVNYETSERPCPLLCPAGAPEAAGSKTVNYCYPPPSGIYQPICPPMGVNYSLVGHNLGMIEAPKHNSAFFHNQYMDPKTFTSDLNEGLTVGSPSYSDFMSILTSMETIGTGAPGGKGKTGFDSQGYYQMPQGVNEAEEVLCEYHMKEDTVSTPTTQGFAKNSKPKLVDILTDPRQVAWMWEGTADSGLPPKDHATQINTLGLYIRGKSTYNPQKESNLNPNTGSIMDDSQCSVWQDSMVDLCMNYEVQDPSDCYRPPAGDFSSTWAIRYPLDIPPQTASPGVNTVCPMIMSKPQQNVWKDYHGIPHENIKNAINSEYNTAKYCKDWYHYMADTYNAYTDKGASVASEKFNTAVHNYCRTDKNRYNFECGCENADPGQFSNLHSSVVSAMQQGGPQSLGAHQKYCYLGACDVGSVGSMQHDRLLDPRYGNWSYPQAPVIQNPHASPCTQTTVGIPCLSPANVSSAPKKLPCYILDPDKFEAPDPQLNPTPEMCPTPQCTDDIMKKFTTTKNINCGGYVDNSLNKCPNLSCEEIIMVQGSTLENDTINSGISICQRHGTNVGKRWKYDEASGNCVFTEDAGNAGNTPQTQKDCKNDQCKTLTGGTNNPYFYPTQEACVKATDIKMNKLPRTHAPPPFARTDFIDNRQKWSCYNNKCISALGVGEYTSEDACSSFCGKDFGKSPIILILIILISIGIFVAFIIFAVKKYKGKTFKKSKKVNSANL